VAAKAVYGFSAEVFSSFAKEIKLISSVHHPNIVSFIGTVYMDDRLWLITELLDAVWVV
jgi:serine/threonine protein kinase